MNDVKWYNLHYFDDRDNFPRKSDTQFFAYLVITETLDTRKLHIMNDDYDEAVEFKNKAEKDEKYTYVGEVLKINCKTNRVIWDYGRVNLT